MLSSTLAPSLGEGALAEGVEAEGEVLDILHEREPLGTQRPPGMVGRVDC